MPPREPRKPGWPGDRHVDRHQVGAPRLIGRDLQHRPDGLVAGRQGRRGLADEAPESDRSVGSEGRGWDGELEPLVRIAGRPDLDRTPALADGGFDAIAARRGNRRLEVRRGQRAHLCGEALGPALAEGPLPEACHTARVGDRVGSRDRAAAGSHREMHGNALEEVLLRIADKHGRPDGDRRSGPGDLLIAGGDGDGGWGARGRRGSGAGSATAGSEEAGEQQCPAAGRTLVIGAAFGEGTTGTRQMSLGRLMGSPVRRCREAPAQGH